MTQTTPQPSAPPSEQPDSNILALSKNGQALSSSNIVGDSGQMKEQLPYPNGSVIKRIVACKYESFLADRQEPSCWQTYIPLSTMFSTESQSEYSVPPQLTRRGLQVREYVISLSLSFTTYSCLLILGLMLFLGHMF